MAKKQSKKTASRTMEAGENGDVSIARVVEICASSPKSFEDAIQNGIMRATKRLRDVRGAWVKEMKVNVRNGQVSEYRVNLQVTFVLED